MPTDHRPRIPMIQKLAYAGPAFSLAVVGIPVYVYIPKFYTDVIGINITLLGYLIFSVRVFDAITDPAIGYLSDRTHTRFGRLFPDAVFYYRNCILAGLGGSFEANRKKNCMACIDDNQYRGICRGFFLGPG